MPAANRMMMGLTPKAHINKAEMMGIQQLARLMAAYLAMLKVGTAIRATTAGRMPANIDATQGISMK